MNMNHYLYPKDGQNDQLPSLAKIFCNLPLFSKYLAIYHFFETQVCETQVWYGTQVSKTRADVDYLN